MHVARLRPLLVDGTFGKNLVPVIRTVCNDWFRDEASLASYVFLSIFNDLIARNWDDPQGVPPAEYNRFVADVLPCLNDVLDALPGDPTSALQQLVLAYHDAI
jgi:hypothetical protein